MSRSLVLQSNVRCSSCLRLAQPNRAGLLRAQASNDPPPAPPLQEIPPPPPPPPESGPPRNVGFWTRRNILGVLLAGSGLWYWKNYDDLDPHVTFERRSSTPDGMEIMTTPTGEMYGVTLVPNKYGSYNFLMVDAYGNIYFDPNDRTQGLYIVDLEGNLVNAYVSSKTPGRVELERIGNINDIKQIPIDGIADISMGADGMMMWAFTDSEEKLEINPLALVQGDADGNIVAGFPAQVDEGVIEVVKEKKGLFSLFQKGRNDFGGPLRPDYLP